ncbi:MAG: hypothetical protein JJU05_01670 [Verrucomicrobia bacterium]|nr:hypothetical protein [Verrucomicrobiota bacterium]MCH8529003.1 hypothetical protein [Kiritimatiellia bacterium]
MKHTIFGHFKLEGDHLTLRTQGKEATVTLELNQIRGVKFPFGYAHIETDDNRFRLDLRNFEPNEWQRVKELLLKASKENRLGNQPLHRSV